MAITHALAVAVTVGVQFSVSLKIQIELEEHAGEVYPSVNWLRGEGLV